MKYKEQQIFNPRKLRMARFISKMKGTYRPRKKANIPIDKLSIERILVQEHHCIGDVIMLEPTLRALKIGFPNAKIDLLCARSVKALAEYAQLADRVYAYPNEIPFRIKYDIVFDFHGDVRRLKLLTQFRAKYRAGFSFSGGAKWLTHVVDYPYSKHQVERPFELLKIFGIDLEDKTPKLKNFNEQDRGAKKIVLHPGANHYARMWPKEQWLALIGMLQAEGYKVVWVNPPGGICKLPIEQFNGDLIELGKLMQTAAMLVGVDSMSGHLAAAVGTPTMTIFGSQDPTLTRPFHKKGYIILPSRHCMHVKKDWRLCAECMATIRPEDIRLQIKKIIK
jgi:ADP-heptose:LPS heptosyltransferase